MSPKKHEENLREEFPSLKDAWEQYQIILKLCLAEKPMPEVDDEDSDFIKRNRARKIRMKKMKEII